MNKHAIVVAYAAGEKRRVQLRAFFGTDARLAFLADMPSGLRQQTLIEATVLLSWNLPRELGPSEYSLLKNVRLLQLISAGADQVPYADLPRDIIIASNAGAYADPMAEHVLAMTLALAKNLFMKYRELAEGRFDQAGLNRTLRGSACGILGFGGIGRAVARLMRPLGVRIHAVNTSGKTGEPVEFVGTLNDLKQVLSASDIVVISLPLMTATRGLIGKRELEWMKPDAILINVARGAIIDERALYEHLVRHPGFMAGIDAWWTEPFSRGEFRVDFPFFALPNFLGSPHNSAIVPGMSEEAAQRAAENVVRFLRGGSVTGVIRRADYL